MNKRILVALFGTWAVPGHSFAPSCCGPCGTAPPRGSSYHHHHPGSAPLSVRAKKKDNEAWDDDVDYEEEFPSDPTSDKSPDPSLPWDTPSNAVEGNSFLETGKLGIKLDLGPISEEQAQEIKAAAAEVINDAIAAGIDDIEALRKKMKKEIEEQRKRMQLESEWNAQKAQEKMMSKIDKLTDDFLSKTAASRRSTKLAAAADRSMEGRGAEMGSWGVLGDTEVAMGSGTTATPTATPDNQVVTTSAQAPKENRIIVIADTQQDAYAKQLLEPLTESLRAVVSDLQVDVFAPTATLPLGGNNAAAVLLFLTSLADASSVKTGLERILRRTMQSDGKLAQPPTQIVAVSTIGTERTNKMPYSMQNLLGGKLDKRRQMEEAVMSVVNRRVDGPSLDYTICKLGEIKPSVSGDFALQYGDSLDGDMEAQSAVQVLQQAIALQSSARNATFSSVGGSSSLPGSQDEWDEAFVPLDGPEIWRKDLPKAKVEDLDRLIEYMHEWGSLPESSKALTTPIRVVLDAPLCPVPGVLEQSVMQLLFLPTNTGDKYLSKSEERARERQGGGSTKSNQSGPEKSLAAARKAKEGGVEVLMEVTKDNQLRVRVRRTNYAPGVVIKEITEETLLGRVKKTLSYWEEQES